MQAKLVGYTLSYASRPFPVSSSCVGIKKTETSGGIFGVVTTCLHSDWRRVHLLCPEDFPKGSRGQWEGLGFPQSQGYLQTSYWMKGPLERANRALDFGTLLSTGGTWRVSILTSLTLSCDQ